MTDSAQSMLILKVNEQALQKYYGWSSPQRPSSGKNYTKIFLIFFHKIKFQACAILKVSTEEIPNIFFLVRLGFALFKNVYKVLTFS